MRVRAASEVYTRQGKGKGKAKSKAQGNAKGKATTDTATTDTATKGKAEGKAKGKAKGNAQGKAKGKAKANAVLPPPEGQDKQIGELPKAKAKAKAKAIPPDNDFTPEPKQQGSKSLADGAPPASGQASSAGEGGTACIRHAPLTLRWFPLPAEARGADHHPQCLLLQGCAHRLAEQDVFSLEAMLGLRQDE